MNNTKITWRQLAIEEVYEQRIKEDEAVELRRSQNYAELIRLLPEALGDIGKQIVAEGKITKEKWIENDGYVFGIGRNDYRPYLWVGKVISPEDEPLKEGDSRYLFHEYGSFFSLAGLGIEINWLEKEWGNRVKETERKLLAPALLNQEQADDVWYLRWLADNIEKGAPMTSKDRYILAAIHLLDDLRRD